MNGTGQECAENLVSSDVADVADDQKNQYDLLFALKSWNPRPMFSRESSKIIEGKILNGLRLHDVVDRLVNEGCGEKNQLLSDAEKILVEMGNTYQLSTVRMLGLFFAKMIRRLYQGLMINRGGFEKLRAAMSQGPVLLLPTHRSYADFILISYLFFTLDLPLPVIAAGMDFKGMKLVSRILQNAGAFYIRRSFREDQLYWTLVSEYVRHHVVNFQAPVEFFIEGTRSRIGKSLPPKSGLLSMALEPFLRGEVPDINICTISISYERTLEENLYAYEVLGIPKPKETTSGFFSAIDKIRDENFGRIYVNVAEPISIRDHLKKRNVPNWHLPTFRLEIDERQHQEIHCFSHDLVCKQQFYAITPVFAILSALLSGSELDHGQLLERFVKLNSLVAKYGTPCLIQGDLKKVIDECLSVHKLKIRSANGKLAYNSVPLTSPDFLGRAASRLVLQQYTNQLLAPLINFAVVAYIEEKRQLNDKDELVKESLFFAKYFGEEFILIRGCDERDVSLVSATDPEIVAVLRPLVQPYVESLYLLLHILERGFSKAKEIPAHYKTVAHELVETGAAPLAEIMAVDKITRHLPNLVSNGHLQKMKSSNENVYNVVDVAGLIAKLGVYVSSSFSEAVSASCQKLSHVQSKL